MSRPAVLVTGGAGFIGSNLVAKLCQSDTVDVVVCDRLRSAASGKWRNLAKHPVHDLIHPEELFDWLERKGSSLTAILHMGAISSTTEADADKIVDNNFRLSRDLLDWCAAKQVRMIYASSAATYGDGALGFSATTDLKELRKLRPLNAYGWSKWLFDLLAMEALQSGRAPPQLVGLKFFNVYGPNEQHKGGMRSVVHQIWPQAAAGEEVSLFKSHRPDYPDGGQLRDFVYVRDVAEVTAWLLDRPDVSGLFNLGSGQARPFADLAAAVFRAAGHEPRIRYVDMPEEIRDKYQYFTQADMSGLRRAGYTAGFTSLEEGVADYVRRFLATPDPYN